MKRVVHAHVKALSRGACVLHKESPALRRVPLMKRVVRVVSFSLYMETACRILPQPFRPRNILLAERTHLWFHQDSLASALCRGKTMHPLPHQVHGSECQTHLPIWIRFFHKNQYSPQSIVHRNRALQLSAVNSQASMIIHSIYLLLPITKQRKITYGDL